MEDQDILAAKRRETARLEHPRSIHSLAAGVRRSCIIHLCVGLAGGSAFVAVLLLLGCPPGEASFYGLAFNSISAATSLVRWSIHFERSLAWYLVGAIPLAYLGGQLRIYEETPRIIMGGAIILSGIAALLANAPLKTRSINAAPRILVGGPSDS
jgi:uncharacterized membrane protein YfcA